MWMSLAAVNIGVSGLCRISLASEFSDGIDVDEPAFFKVIDSLAFLMESDFRNVARGASSFRASNAVHSGLLRLRDMEMCEVF